MADPKFVWPRQEATIISDAHIVKDPYMHVEGKVGVETYCGIWYAWGSFDSNAYVFRERCIACLKGYMSDNVVINEPDRG